MAAQPSSLSILRYQEFRSPCSGGWPEDTHDFGKMVDEDGSTLYENEYSALLTKIVQLNDVAALGRYLVTNTRHSLGPGCYHTEDPFYNAVAYGSTDALRMLLEHWDAANPSTRSNVPAPGERAYGLLQVACASAYVETVRFLLSDPWQAAYGDIHKRDDWGSTALLAATRSFYDPQYSLDRTSEENYSIQSHLARAEEVVQLLLDRGACVQDVVIGMQEPWETVLSSAISRASLTLVKRLITQGADVYAKKTHNLMGGGFCLKFGDDHIRDVTALHIGSQYSNFRGIKALLDYARDTGGVDLVQQTDSLGHLPLHWAAWGPDDELYMLEADEIVPHVTATIELLLEINPSTVNAQDKLGNTALHYAVWRHGICGNKHVAIPQVLCKHGADASLRGRNGETALHGLGFRFIGSEPIDTGLIDLLLEQGASVGDTDQDGNTPLHFAAKNLMHIEAARHLLNRGADVSATNHKGNTPLHEVGPGTIRSFLFLGKTQFTIDDLVQAQDEMLRILLHGVSEESADALMDQPNAANKTPRQICEERRKEWRDKEDAQRNQAAGRGRGRGRGSHSG
jgi:ankyrin repeat protein